jgi:hypothetical protein
MLADSCRQLLQGGLVEVLAWLERIQFQVGE